MKVLVSACLIGENCKYSGGNNYCEEMMKKLEGCEIIRVCPEVFGGLPIPRDPAEIVNGCVKTKAGKDVTKEYVKGAEISLKMAIENQVDCCILQSRSPSCGCKQIYDGTFSKTLIEGAGIFARMLRQREIPVIDVEDFIKE